MTTPLIGALALAIYNCSDYGIEPDRTREPNESLPEGCDPEYYRRRARAALSAIEQHGDVTVVGDVDVKDWLRDAAEKPDLEAYKFAMRTAADEIERLRALLSARPKVTGNE